MDSDSNNVDWLSVTSSLKLLKESLICAICKDLLMTPVLLTVCSHNFCSICIRRYFTIKQECPICGLEASSNNLAPNRLVETLTKHFYNFRSLLEKVLKQISNNQQVSSNCNKNEKEETSVNIVDVTSENQNKYRTKENDQTTCSTLDLNSIETEATPKFSLAIGDFCTQSQDFSSENNSSDSLCPQGTKNSLILTASVDNGTNSPSSNIPGNNDSQRASNDEADCPVCGLQVSTSKINSHLDNCLAREEKKNSLRQNTPKRKKRNNPPTAKLAYNLLSLRELRKKMKDIGLPTNGDKPDLKRRHQEFVIKYQAEMDKASPRPVSIVIEELKREEAKRKDFESKSKFLGNMSPSKSTDVVAQNRDHIIKHAKQYRQLEELAEKSLSKRRKTTSKNEETNYEQNGSDGIVLDSEPFPSSSFEEIPLSSLPACPGSGDSPDLYIDEPDAEGSRPSDLRTAIEADSQAEQIKDCIDASLSEAY